MAVIWKGTYFKIYEKLKRLVTSFMKSPILVYFQAYSIINELYRYIVHVLHFKFCFRAYYTIL